jgi:hypothetical protein
LAERGWWSTKVRQFRAHVRARVSPEERTGLTGWLTPPQLALFDSMAVADQRHGLDVVATLRATRPTHGIKDPDVVDPDLLLAGLLHDAGKDASVGLWPRVAWSLGDRYGAWVWRVAGLWPGFTVALETLHDHAERSAELAERAGCSARVVELIRNQAAPDGQEAGLLLLAADEAN